NPSDSVAVALRALSRGDEAMGVLLCDDIPAGHKFALGLIRAGEAAIKYGFPIGVATVDIRAGEHVHTHNLANALDDVVVMPGASACDKNGRKSEISDLKFEISDSKSQISDLKFDGFRRADGRVGIRNEIWVINTVACVNQAAQQIALNASRELELGKYGVDGVYTFPHPFGCSQ